MNQKSSLVRQARSVSEPFLGNYPRLRRQGCGADGFQDGAEVAGAREAGCVDDGAYRSLALGGPHRAVAVGHLPLDYRRAQRPLAGLAGRRHDTRMVKGDRAHCE